MTKWFDTNYHYLAPELSPGQAFALTGTKPVDEFLEAGAVVEGKPVVRHGPALAPAAEDAVAALVALGQQRAEAEEKVRRVVGRDAGKQLTTADGIVAAVFGG